MLASTQGRTLVTGSAPPLVVDLDGTLLRSDLLLETGMAFLRSHPLQLLKPFKWLANGKATLKSRLANATHIDVNVLPYNREVIALIETARSAGRSVVLATASHHSLAERIAEHLDLFDSVLASDEKTNLSSHRKRDLLVEHYGVQGFDYIGNSMTISPSGPRHEWPTWSIRSPASSVERELRVMSNKSFAPHRRPSRTGPKHCACING